jgi:hypothetical protein
VKQIPGPVYQMTHVAPRLAGLPLFLQDWPLVMAEIAVAVVVFQVVLPKRGSGAEVWRRYAAAAAVVLLLREIDRVRRTMTI